MSAARTRGAVKLTRSVTINGERFAAGAVVVIDREAARTLFRQRAAVPAPGPGARLHTQDRPQ